MTVILLIVMQVPMGRKLSLFLLIIHKLIRFKLIIIIHDIEELRKIYIKRKYQITVERKFYQNCDVLICHNNNMKNHLIGRNISGIDGKTIGNLMPKPLNSMVESARMRLFSSFAIISCAEKSTSI